MRIHSRNVAVTPVPVPAPPAPEEFSEPERRIWDQTLRGMRPGYFSESFAPLLHSYCMCCVIIEELQRIADQLSGRSFDDGDVWRAAVAAQAEIMRTLGPIDVT